jgi:hypothetical protein
MVHDSWHATVVQSSGRTSPTAGIEVVPAVECDRVPLHTKDASSKPNLQSQEVQSSVFEENVAAPETRQEDYRKPSHKPQIVKDQGVSTSSLDMRDTPKNEAFDSSGTSGQLCNCPAKVLRPSHGQYLCL